jgi:hypothetical protein
MMRRFIRSVGYARVRGALGVLYVLLGTIILVRTCTPLTALNFTKISPLVLGAAITGLGILRIRDLLTLRGKTST